MTWRDLLNPEFYIQHGGLWLIIFIIFAETGLFVGFFLPGDSLLFVAGIYSHNLANELFKIFGIAEFTNEYAELFILAALISVAGIIGNYVGFWFGRKIGPGMYHWKDNMLFKKKYLHEAHDFYEKHGGAAIVYARFLPIIRTFAPIVAGIVGMDRKKFHFFSIVGCIAWVCSMLIAGHYLYKLFLEKFHFDLKAHLEIIVLGIVLVTTLPVLYKFIFSKAKARSKSPDQ